MENPTIIDDRWRDLSPSISLFFAFVKSLYSNHQERGAPDQTSKGAAMTKLPVNVSVDKYDEANDCLYLTATCGASVYDVVIDFVEFRTSIQDMTAFNSVSEPGRVDHFSIMRLQTRILDACVRGVFDNCGGDSLATIAPFEVHVDSLW